MRDVEASCAALEREANLVASVVGHLQARERLGADPRAIVERRRGFLVGGGERRPHEAVARFLGLEHQQRGGRGAHHQADDRYAPRGAREARTRARFDRSPVALQASRRERRLDVAATIQVAFLVHDALPSDAKPSRSSPLLRRRFTVAGERFIASAISGIVMPSTRRRTSAIATSGPSASSAP